MVFLAPTVYRDRIEVDTAIVKIGNKRLHVHQRIIDTVNNVVKSTCTTVMVGFDVASNTSKEISQTWKDAIRAYEQNPNL